MDRMTLPTNSGTEMNKTRAAPDASRAVTATIRPYLLAFGATLILFAGALTAFASQPREVTSEVRRLAVKASAEVLASRASGINPAAVTAAALCIEIHANDAETFQLAAGARGIDDNTARVVAQIAARHDTFICLDRAAIRGLRVH